jgi:alkanesulfonate monooxygenase SsuD/methylene tetrahydromethanopterin reductase-like flavin-dependent oxidoreductase (luciferase family)
MEPLWHDGERATVESRLRAAIVGSNTTVHAGLEKLVNDTHADELIIVTDTYEHSDRIDSYERVARIARNIKRAADTPTSLRDLAGSREEKHGRAPLVMTRKRVVK